MKHNLCSYYSMKHFTHKCINMHGFCRRKSTATNLLECFNDWTLTILTKEQQIVAYIFTLPKRLT